MRQRLLPSYLRHALYSGVAMALCAPLATLAQDAAQAGTGSASAAPQDTSATADQNNARQLGKIVVTAQTRTQEMQEVPIALQIVTAAQIQQLAATDLSKMSIFVPGLGVDGSQPTQPSYELRGISTSNFGIGTEPAVGVYVDGVYAARSGGALLAFNDIQRIEVLKGPQGTLFGRNAAGGAISIVTNEPSDKLEGHATVRFGNEGEKYVSGLLNLPINKDMALRVSVVDNQSDGWITNQADGKRFGGNDDWGTRIAYRWNITPDTRVLVSWDHERLDQTPRPQIGIVPMSSDVYERPPFPADPTTFLNPLHAPLYNVGVDLAETRTFNGANFVIDHSFSWGSLTATTAWRGFDTYNDMSNDGTNHVVTHLDTANIEHNNSWYQEFKLTGNNDLMDWVSGVSFYSEQARQANQVNTNTDSLDTLALNVAGAPFPPLATITQGLQAFGLPYNFLGDSWREQINNNGNFKAYAAFGDVIWHLNDKLDLTTGLRYTKDDKDFTWYNVPRQAPAYDQTLAALMASGIYAILPTIAQQALTQFSTNVVFPNDVGDRVEASNSWHDFSPRAVLSYKFTPDIMGYGSVTKGYKAGGYNSLEIGSVYAPEKVWNYEFGLKTVFPEYNLLFNTSAYYYKYSNLQSNVLNPNYSGSGVPFYEVSTSDQHAKGVEFETQWFPVDALRLNLTAAYIDATYLRDTSTTGVNLAGQATGEPLWSATAGFDYTWHGVMRGDLEASMQYAYRGATRCNADSGIQGACYSTKAFTIGTSTNRTDARLDWHTPDQKYGVGLYGNNIFNKRYVLGVGNETTTVFGTPYATVTPPRTFGIEFRAGF
ncbi:TonB-dependent receptor [Dyella solisilvae]|uniref:TonB-dependent receptor n=1 Tax=Dyella solisilvae TaxID=1920168 RepID=A0A370K7V7_9GAMM|nr:TonB-dependent receptor [Dyella solisilvae]RDI98738.1 TonB-dependent receptor [Dyella solisilvae]